MRGFPPQLHVLTRTRVSTARLFTQASASSPVYRAHLAYATICSRVVSALPTLSCTVLRASSLICSICSARAISSCWRSFGLSQPRTVCCQPLVRPGDHVDAFAYRPARDGRQVRRELARARDHGRHVFAHDVQRALDGAAGVHARLGELALADQRADAVDQIRARAAGDVRRAVQRAAVVRVLRQERLGLLARDAVLGQRLVHLGLRALARLEQEHLHAALNVDRAVARWSRSRRRSLPDTAPVTSSARRRTRPSDGMQPNGFTLTVMCALSVHDVQDQLADLHVAFAAAQVVVVVTVRGRRDLVHVGQVVARAADRLREDLERRRAARCRPTHKPASFLADVDVLQAELARASTSAQRHARLRCRSWPSHSVVQQPVA